MKRFFGLVLAGLLAFGPGPALAQIGGNINGGGGSSGSIADGSITAAKLADGAVDLAGAKVTGTPATATALAANPTDCGAGEYANAIAANGNLTCATPAGATAPTSGTWTPVIVGSSTPGSGSYNTQFGIWRKMALDSGYEWSVTGYVRGTIGTQTGNVLIGGLPTASTNTAQSNGVCAIGEHQSITASGKAQLSMVVVENTTTIAVRASVLGGTYADVAVADWGAAALVRFTCTFTTAS